MAATGLYLKTASYFTWNTNKRVKAPLNLDLAIGPLHVAFQEFVSIKDQTKMVFDFLYLETHGIVVPA